MEGGENAARNHSISIQYDSRECNLVKKNTNISTSTEVMNNTNPRKQLATEEAREKAAGSWGSQVSINQCHTN